MGEVTPFEEKPAEPATRERRRRRRRQGTAWLRHAPLAVFAFIVTVGPLLFGAVDRPVQIVLVGVLAAGFALRPPDALPRRAQWILLGVVAFLLLAQFGPWQGLPRWRAAVSSDLGIPLPWTRHPEPARALDALVAAAVAVLWFAWVRGLASDRETRVRMIFVLVAAGAAVAAICFVAKGPESGSIYGIRPTPGWIGWGPFPNRNHTASFLAMAALASTGAAVWAIAKRRRLVAACAGCAFAVIVAALLLSKSRGGLVAFGAGLGTFAAGILIRHRNRRAVALVLGLVAVTAGLLLAFGGSVLSRFTSREEGGVSNDFRRAIWSDARGMWADAPILGHGLESFPQLFPVYTQRDFDGQTVRHPESSWLLWLTETGTVFTAALAIALIAGLAAAALRSWKWERRGSYLTAGAIAGVVALLVHAVIDVPAHRWGTAGFALALLAIAWPSRSERPMPRLTALAPVAIAAFWALPWMLPIPWSPVHLARLISKEAAQTALVPVPQVPRAEWERVLKFFPIDPLARHYAGIAALAAPNPDAAAIERDFNVARKLGGSSWGYSIMEARAYGGRFPAQAIAAWQDACRRAGRRASEVLRTGLSETAAAPPFWVLWGQFVEQRPDLAITYAVTLLEDLKQPPGTARNAFDLWCEQRMSAPNLSEPEIADFYSAARVLGNPAMLSQWIEAHPDRWKTDYKQWARLFASWGKIHEAWETYARVVHEPALGTPPSDTQLAVLDSQFRASPENAHVALALAQHLDRAGQHSQAEAVVLRFAERDEAPVWFRRKAAHILAARQQFAAAVDMALREK